jgi:uncharacterized coiled-coil protein SlyX
VFVQESLEARILELERALEAEQKNGQRERLALTRLQRQLARVSNTKMLMLNTFEYCASSDRMPPAHFLYNITAFFLV